MISAALVLEGGGMRGVYTAGVLDCLMDEDMLFSTVFSVSAGACHATSYLSGQRGRAFRISTNYLHDSRYCSIKSFLKTGDIFGVDMCYHLIPEQLDPYDYDAFAAYPGKFFAAVTDCQTGTAAYLPISDMRRDVMSICASSSLPLLSHMVRINQREYLDGGIADSIPVRAALLSGCKKAVVVLTQCEGYVKKKNPQLPIAKLKYHRYPKLVEAIATRHIHYNDTLNFLHEAQARGEIFIIQPLTTPNVGRTEKNLQKLTALYEQGYQNTKQAMPALRAYLAK